MRRSDALATLVAAVLVSTKVVLLLLLLANVVFHQLHLHKIHVFTNYHIRKFLVGTCTYVPYSSAVLATFVVRA